MPLNDEKERKELTKEKRAKVKVLGISKESTTNQKGKESHHGLIHRGHSLIQKLGKAVIGTVIGTKVLGKEIKDQRKAKALGNQRKEKVKVRPAWT